MGLDMMLFRRHPRDTSAQPVAYDVEELVYWGKANQVHRWFVKHCQNDRDDCKPYPVSRAQLEDLLTSVKAVIVDPTRAEELLPTQSGFFFGGTEYDGYYRNQLKHTEKTLTEILAKPDVGEIFYQSSW